MKICGTSKLRLSISKYAFKIYGKQEAVDHVKSVTRYLSLVFAGPIVFGFAGHPSKYAISL